MHPTSQEVNEGESQEVQSAENIPWTTRFGRTLKHPVIHRRDGTMEQWYCSMGITIETG